MHILPCPVTYCADDRTVLVAVADALALPLSVVDEREWVDSYLGCPGAWDRVQSILSPVRADGESMREVISRVIGT